MKLLEADGVTDVLRSDNNQTLVTATNGSGYYKLNVPHEGNWVVQADSSLLTPLRKLVKKDQGTDQSINSRFDRNTNLAAVTVTADVPAGRYNLPNVNAGFYNVPQLDLADQVLHVGDSATTVTPSLLSPVDPTNPVVNYGIATGAPDRPSCSATGSGRGERHIGAAEDRYHNCATHNGRRLRRTDYQGCKGHSLGRCEVRQQRRGQRQHFRKRRAALPVYDGCRCGCTHG